MITTPFSLLRNCTQHPYEVDEVKFLAVGDNVGVRTVSDGVRGTSSTFKRSILSASSFNTRLVEESIIPYGTLR